VKAAVFTLSGLLLGGALLASCQDATQVNVAVRTNVPFRDGVSMAIWTTAGGSFTDGPPQASTGDAWLVDGVMGDLVVTPRVHNEESLAVRVVLGVGRDPRTCSDQDAKGCIVAKRKLAFVPHTRLRVPIVLHIACSGVVCGEDSTCNYLGRCASATLDANACRGADGCVLDGDQTVTGVAAPDAGASPPDAQVTVPDASVVVVDAGPPPFCSGALLTNAPYAGGTGTPADPFLICAPAQFTAIADRSADWSASFKLMGSVDLAGVVVKPIATTGTPFLGTFDGNALTLSNLTITQPTASNIGLFAFIGNQGVVRNVTLGVSRIEGGSTVGALAGNNAGTISGVRINGPRDPLGDVRGSSDVGGAVGTNQGTVSDVRTNVAVVNSGVRTGGLVGYSLGTVTTSSARGLVRTTKATGCTHTGGLVGYATAASKIEKSMAAGAVTSPGGTVGGFVGWGQGAITDCYATGNVSGGPSGGAGSCGVGADQSFTGGFVGAHVYATSVIKNAYATGNVTATGSWVGGFVGLSFSTCSSSNTFSTGTATGTGAVAGYAGANDACTIAGAYWDTFKSGTSLGSGGSQAGVTGVNTQVPANNNYFYGPPSAPLAAWDFANTWTVRAGAYPALTWELAP